MTEASTTGPVSALERARRAVPVLAEHAAETEAARRVHPASLAAVRDAGLFALPVPGRFGGSAVRLAESIRVVIEVGRGCPSTSWVVGTSATSKAFVPYGLADGVLAKLFAEADTMFCGSGKPGGKAISVSGGYRLSGRWEYVSGAEDSAVAGLGVMLCGDGADDKPPVFGLTVLPTEELTIDRTWDAVGLSGTGSHTVVADEVFVPADRAGTVEMHPTFMLTGTAYVLAPVLGAALGALDATKQLFASGANRFGNTYQTIAQSPRAQHLLAGATLLIDEAIERCLMWCTAVDNGEVATPLEIARARSGFASAARDALAALERMVDLHGTKGMAKVHPVQRFWRDASVGARHVLLNQFMIEEEYGKLVARAA